jgi:hypothetical protein
MSVPNARTDANSWQTGSAYIAATNLLQYLITEWSQALNLSSQSPDSAHSGENTPPMWISQ